MTHPIPREALDDRHAFVGTAGSGKTYSVGTAVERVLHAKGRVVIIDPLGVWWGLRLTLDGQTPSPFKVVIFGGAHGDLPINEHAGALIGETVAGMAESCILDLSGIGTKAGERRFMLAFLTALYRKTTGEPVHVVFDEADMFAPQRLLDKEGEAAKLLGMMETIVRRGRVKGFIPWLISQRPAALSKDVLSQADGLVAFKLTSSQDRDAIGAWIEGQADKATGKEMLASLPGMQVGQAVVWIPGRGVLSTAQFPHKATYDSSRTPKRGEKVRAANLKPIDLGALKERLATVEAEFKANDPKALRAEIAALKRQLATNPVEKINTPDPAALNKAYDNGYRDGEKHGLAEGKDAAAQAIYNGIVDFAEEFAVKVSKIIETAAPRRAVEAIRPRPAIKAPSAPKPAAPLKTTNGHDLTGPQKRVADSLQFWRAIGHASPSREQVAAVAGYSPGSGNFQNLLGQMRASEMIAYPSTGVVSLVSEIGEAMSPDEAAERLKSVLNGPQRKIVEAVDGTMTREEVAEASGYSVGSGNFQNLLGSLRTLDVIRYPMTGHVELSSWASELLS